MRVIYARNFTNLKLRIGTKLKRKTKESRVIISARKAKLNRDDTNIADDTCNENDWQYMKIGKVYDLYSNSTQLQILLKNCSR